MSLKAKPNHILEHSSQEEGVSGNLSNWESLGGEVFVINVINDGNGWLNLFTRWRGVLIHRKQKSIDNWSEWELLGNIKGSSISILYPNCRLEVYAKNSKI